jgi:hypothetical protein
VRLLEVEPLDLGEDVRAIGLEFVEDNEDREPVRGSEAAAIWAHVLRAAVGDQPWALDFFSHVDRVRDFCERHAIGFREATPHSIVVPAPQEEDLQNLLDRFQNETFGARAGGPLPEADPGLEGELARRGVDAYQKEFPRYFFCAICDFENGSLVVLSKKLWASEVIRRIQPVLKEMALDVRMGA